MRLPLKPEHLGSATFYYNEERSRRYAEDSKKHLMQHTIAYKALHLLKTGPGDGRLILDVGCGTGYVGEILTEKGYNWLGLDISRPMLEASQNLGGNTVVADMGQGLPFRKKIFDGVISVSSLQWLCYRYDGKCSRIERIRRFFHSLFECLVPGASCVFQYYPEDERQVKLINKVAENCGFFVTHRGFYLNNPHHSSRFLVLSTVRPSTSRMNVHSNDYWPSWEPPNRSIIGMLLLGWKPNCRELLSFTEYPAGTAVHEPELFLVDKDPEVDGEPFPCELISEILLQLARSSSFVDLKEDRLDKNQDLEARLDWSPNWTPPLQQVNPFLEANLVLNNLRLVCKRWYFHLRPIFSVEYLLYHESNQKWITFSEIPSYSEMFAERVLMLDCFLDVFLTNHPIVNLRTHSRTSLVSVFKRWLASTAELFFLEQFFVWIQLNKYVIYEERQWLVPPIDVIHIWSLCSRIPAFRRFSNYFCGYLVDIEQCHVIHRIDVQQGYRELSEKVKRRRNYIMPEREYSLRDFTWRQVALLFGRCDAYTWHPEASDLSCFGGRTKIKMGDGSKKEIRFIKPGEFVMTAVNVPRCVLAVDRCVLPIIKNMVKFSDFWITRGHPIHVNGDWYRPDELSHAQPRFVPALLGIFNLVLEEEHTVIVGSHEIVCCTLGKYCGERLEKLHPGQNRRYGPRMISTGS
eukprot:TRINITY_DN11836_c0_g1_i4.p1 TRINITY_DN11836_c0_g1~~TRINITY_DN11836_c0_g1_i4.p1  ORF type:complete len:689 (+),score=66.31 TRINITY_DN11836_c0_g1_i4:58-2124(+)